MEIFMTVQKSHNILNIRVPHLEQEDEYNIPLDISDIISICQEYNKMGPALQKQLENLIECGIEESLADGSVKKESLPYIKDFLLSVSKNAYFGDAVLQVQEILTSIKQYEEVARVRMLN